MKKIPSFYLSVLFAILALWPLQASAGGGVMIIPVAKAPGPNVAVKSTVIRTRESLKNTASYIASEAVISSCHSGEVLTGGSCSALLDNFDSNTTNMGVPWACGMAGNSVWGVSLATALTLDVKKYGPPIKVYAVCATTTATAKMSARQAPLSEPERIKLKEKIKRQVERIRSAYESRH